ncbi:hypothetical protein K504DRAFT_84975 [Pleomassaria siparia CBS 279.74]|uniref:Uncharacterized protein n=1 Tax=Pleomassaria siparia CBS 279.74 TaxID=1314801 RepID=A0A6G1K0B2_9PLEO|nr:hypothetical protein K504DRAFT_84975 [Pleomassaria siparia CBS 279.74]
MPRQTTKTTRTLEEHVTLPYNDARREYKVEARWDNKTRLTSAAAKSRDHSRVWKNILYYIHTCPMFCISIIPIEQTMIMLKRNLPRQTITASRSCEERKRGPWISEKRGYPEK